MNTLLVLQNSTGHAALTVNTTLIMTSEPHDDSQSLLSEIADRLSVALGVSVSVRDTENLASDATSWNQVIAGLPLPPLEAPQSGPEALVCKACGSAVTDGLCDAGNCIYAEWPQSIPASDLAELTPDLVAAKHGVIRAEAHSDDFAIVVPFFDAAAWFAAAEGDTILALANEGWGTCEEADRVAEHFEKLSHVAPLFGYISSKTARSHDIGFECIVSPADAQAWLRRNRYGLWARILCDEAAITVLPHEEANGTRWRWVSGEVTGTADFDSLDEACANAVSTLGLDNGEQVTTQSYLAFWSINAFSFEDGRDLRQIVGTPFFCDDNSYSANDIEAILALAVGETWQSPDYGKSHTVTRHR